MLASCTIASNRVSDLQLTNSFGAGVAQIGGSILILNSLLQFSGVNGSAKTNNSLDLTVTTGEIAASSTEGECTITITHGEANSESGTATCTKMESSQGTINLKATFSAAP